MSRYFYISERRNEGTDAGNKARNDVEIIFSQSDGLTPLYLYINGKPNNKFVVLTNLLKNIINATSKNDIIFLQYPMLIGYNWLIPLLTKLRKTVFLVHDINSLRFGGNEKTEFRRFKNVHKIISHNTKMTQYLVKNGVPETKILDLEIFDYLTENNEPLDHWVDDSLLCYAGNLLKSKFLYKLPKSAKTWGLNVYGSNLCSEKDINFHYKGSFDSEIIHKKLEGKFGLIWDGEECSTCSGALGNYMKYNNPHKFSLYIAAGIPIIIWRYAAMADIAEKMGVGLLIESLDELDNFADSINENTYRVYQDNVIRLRNEIIKGKKLNRIIRQIRNHTTN